MKLSKLVTQYIDLKQSMGPNGETALEIAFGESAIRLLIAEANNQTLVVTFGGGTAYMDKSLQAARSGGTISSDEGVAKAMKLMPKKQVAAGVFSIKNMVQAGLKSVQNFAPPGAIPAPIANFQFQGKLPVAFVMGVEGSGIEMVTFIPTSVVSDVVDLVKTVQSLGASPEGGMPAPPADDF